MKTSELFELAKDHLAMDYAAICTAPHAEKFICMAISTAFLNTSNVAFAELIRCQNIIKSRLEDCGTLESWLASKGCIHVDYHFADCATKDRIQRHRHAWLDLLIEEFKAKGD